MVNDLITITHVADNYDKYLNAVVPPVFLNSLHVFEKFEDYCNVDVFEEDNFIYGRTSNPTVSILEKKIAQLECGSRAVAFSSGMAAATATIMTICKTESHIICMKDVYQPVKKFLNNYCVPKLKMKVTYVTGNDLDEVEEAMKKPNTDLMILESPATFVFKVVDLEAVSKLAKRYKVKTYIDNSCLTPFFQKPLELGIDIVMHTMTKYIGGHSDIIGGVLVSKDEELMKKIIKETREWMGGILGPMEGWLAIRGLRTLHARLVQHQETGLQVAHFLENHTKVKKVNYTGLDSHPQSDIIRKQQKGHTSLMSFELDTTIEKSISFINNLKLFGKGCSWGGYESLAILPLYQAEQEELDFLKVSRNLIRIYCGLEGSENLLEDLDQALKAL